MRRLRESEGPVSPIEAAAIELVRAAAVHQAPAGEKQRVRARLLQQRVKKSAFAIRPAVIIASILFGAAASAAVGRHWIAHTFQTLAGPRSHEPPSKPLALSAARTARTKARASNAPHSSVGDGEAAAGAADEALADNVGVSVNATDAVALPVTPATTDPVPQTANPTSATPTVSIGEIDGDSKLEIDRGVATPGSTRARRHWRGIHSSRSQGSRGDDPRSHDAGSHNEGLAFADVTGTARRRATDGQTNRARQRAARGAAGPGAMDERGGADARLVFDAMRLLRQEQRPDAASDRLALYLRWHANGPLAEEALALSVEAAVAQGSPSAGQLIDRYLQRYPGGHFQSAMEIARARLSP